MFEGDANADFALPGSWCGRGVLRLLPPHWRVAARVQQRQLEPLRAAHHLILPPPFLPSPYSGPEIPAGTHVRSSVSVRATCSVLRVR